MQFYRGVAAVLRRFCRGSSILKMFEERKSVKEALRKAVTSTHPRNPFCFIYPHLHPCPPPSPHSRIQKPNPMCNASLWDLPPARVLSGIKSNPSVLFNRRAWNLWLFATDRLENKPLSELENLLWHSSRAN